MSDGRDNKGRFAPGNPGGPGPRGRSFILTPYLLEECEAIHAETGIPKGKLLAQRVMGRALDMEEWAVKLVYERVEGKAKEQVSIDMALSEPIRLFDVGAEQEAE